MFINYRSLWATAWFRRALIVFILVAAIATFAVAMGTSSHATGPDGTEAVEVNAEESLGVYVNNYESNASVVRDAMVGAGAKWTRLAIDWKTVEPTDGATYAWTYYDDILDDMNDDGYKVIISLLNYPGWATETSGHACGPVDEDDWDDFADFAAAAVTRYYLKGVIYYELGNEPDNQDPVNYGWLYGCWGDGSDQTASNAGGDKYAGFMAEAYPDMKAVHSDIVVMMGGLAYDS